MKQHHHKRSESKLRFSSKRIFRSARFGEWLRVDPTKNPGPKRIRHTLVAASKANAPPKLCPVKIKSQSLGTALKRPRSAAVQPSFRSPPPEVTRATYISKGKEFMATIWNHLQMFFFARAKINLENQHGTENHRIGGENPSEPNL